MHPTEYWIGLLDLVGSRVSEGMLGTTRCDHLWGSGPYHSLRVPETTSGDPAGHGSAWYDIAYGLYADVRHGLYILFIRVTYTSLVFILWHGGGLRI